MKVRAGITIALVAASSLLSAGPAAAGEPICIPGANGWVTILGKEYRLPVGHSLPCADWPL